MSDPFRLQRFVDAQESVYASVLDELRAGKKQSHWMWFIFPQIEGLGSSAMAQRYAISSLDEARAYLAHPVLGARLRECSRLVAGIAQRSLSEVFGYPDDLKFCSSMSLFAQLPRISPDDDIFHRCLQKYCGGKPDRATLALL